MNELAIRAQHLSKRYRIGAPVRRGTLRDEVGGWLRAPHRLLRRKKTEEFWALRDVSFDVRSGEVLGVIGRNGAGKTTLLKILSRITRPTGGAAEVRGHVGSLLEVGTGFHPELTGRENTFLSGAILGMTRKEILRKFDDIVAFAEIEQFIDTPVKHYSSGMYIRLAFAVAAHLEPEILLVDEVLAVGDAAFQKKCLGKMGDVSRHGRTVVFVSHNMGALAQLCQRCILLDAGALMLDGPPDHVIGEHLRTCGGLAGEGKDWERTGSGRVRITSVELRTEGGLPVTSLSMGENMRIRVAGRAERHDLEFSLSAQFMTATGTAVLFLYDQFRTFRPGTDGTFLIELSVPRVMLTPGLYYLNVWTGRAGMEEYDYVRNVASLDLIQGKSVPVMMPITADKGLVFENLHAEQLQ
jgi:lipopolysaccharide transport system ATP-binding protein